MRHPFDAAQGKLGEAQYQLRNLECGLQNCQFALGQAIEMSKGRRGAVNGPGSHVKDIDNGKPNPNPCLSRSPAWILVMRVDRKIKCDYNYGHDKRSFI